MSGRHRLNTRAALKTVPIAVVCSCLPLAAGQEIAVTPPASQPAPAADTTLADVTAEEIERQIQLVEATTDLEESERSELLSLYRTALNQYESAQTWRERIAQFESARQKAPAELDEINAKLKQASSQPVTEIPEGASLEDLTRGLAETQATLNAARHATQTAEENAKSWADRWVAIPNELRDVNERLEAVGQELDVLKNASLPPHIARARRLLSSDACVKPDTSRSRPEY